MKKDHAVIIVSALIIAASISWGAASNQKYTFWTDNNGFILRGDRMAGDVCLYNIRGADQEDLARVGKVVSLEACS